VNGRDWRGFGYRLMCATLLAVLGSGCATTGPGGKKSLILIGDGEERSLGSRMAGQIKAESQIVTDPTVNEYVNRVGQRIVRLSDRPGIPYEFVVIESKDVNAFALPGGYIYVYTGLLKHLDTEAQLAGVLGHEISHVVARHGVKQLQEGMGLQVLSQILLGGSSETTQALVGQSLALLMKGYSRSMESEADHMGILYSTRAGHNPRGMVQVLEKLNQLSGGGGGFWESLSSDHPPPARRIAAVKADMNAMGLDVGLPDNAQAYQTMRVRLK